MQVKQFTGVSGPILALDFAALGFNLADYTNVVVSVGNGPGTWSVGCMSVGGAAGTIQGLSGIADNTAVAIGPDFCSDALVVVFSAPATGSTVVGVTAWSREGSLRV